MMTDLSNIPTADLVAELASRTKSTEPKAQAIIIAVAQAFDIAITDLLSESRQPKLANPRMIAMAICRKATSLSLHQLGTIFNRNHATIVNATKRFPKISSAPHYAALVHQLCIQFAIPTKISKTSVHPALLRSKFLKSPLPTFSGYSSATSP